MQQVLKTLSRLLEPDRGVLTADDIAGLDEPSRRFLTDQQILVQAGNAAHVVCDACHEDHVERVERVVGGDGVVRFQMYCEHAGMVEVDPGRVVQWRLDSARLANLLSDCIEPGRSADGVIPNSAWWIGTISIGEGIYNIYFVRNGSRGIESAIKRIARQGKPGRSILVGLRPWEEDTSQFAVATDLSSAFTWNGNTLSLQTSRIAAGLPLDLYEGNLFLLNGDNYRIRFEGREIDPKKSAGLFYIACLLQNRPEAISSVELQAIRNGQSTLVLAGSSGEVMGHEGLRILNERLEELDEEIAAAKEDRDEGQLIRLQNEREQVLAEVRKATGMGGRTRNTSDAEKARKAVLNAINGAITKISKAHPELGQHLDKHIETGTHCRYTLSHDEIDWLV
ncbi:MAG: hypothetical protein Tsb009_20900 [Planctomycetaceae bacterium]